MLEQDDRVGLEIPPGVSPDSIMMSLELGHGYVWRVIVREPVLVAHGSTKYGDMPEILLLAGRTLILSGGGNNYVARIQSILAMLQRQKRNVPERTGGVAFG